MEIQSFWGYSKNAVKTQIRIAVTTYALVAIVKKKLKTNQSMHEILQILSVSVFDKTALGSLFPEHLNKINNDDSEKSLQLAIF